MSALKSRKNDPRNDDYTEMLLSYVKLYIFVEEKDIQPLKRFALTQFHKMLSIFEIILESTRNLTTTIRYAYEQTVRLSDEKKVMKKALYKYVDCMMIKLNRCERFSSFSVRIRTSWKIFVKKFDRYCVTRTNELF